MITHIKMLMTPTFPSNFVPPILRHFLFPQDGWSLNPVEGQFQKARVHVAPLTAGATVPLEGQERVGHRSSFRAFSCRSSFVIVN